MKFELHLHIWLHEVPNDELIVAMTQARDRDEAIMDAVHDVYEHLKTVMPAKAQPEDREPVISPLDEKR